MTNSFKYFETDGFLVLNMTGGTTNGKVVLKLSDISLSVSRDTDEVTTFEGQFTKDYQPTYLNWSVSCSGAICSDTGESEFQHPLSGDTKIVNTWNGLDLLEEIKTRTANAQFILKISASNYQKGNVILSSFELSGSVGSHMTYSIELQGCGQLTKVTS